MIQNYWKQQSTCLFSPHSPLKPFGRVQSAAGFQVEVNADPTAGDQKIPSRASQESHSHRSHLAGADSRSRLLSWSTAPIFQLEYLVQLCLCFQCELICRSPSTFLVDSECLQDQVVHGVEGSQLFLFPQCFSWSNSESSFMSSFFIPQFTLLNKDSSNKKTIHLKQKFGKLLGRRHSISLNHS